MSADVSSTLNCRSDVSDLRQLENMVGEVAAILEHQSQLNAALSQSLQKLSDYCDCRFESEEESSLFSQGKDTPWLLERVSRVKQQHKILRNQISTLVKESNGEAPILTLWLDFKTRFDAFQRSLVSHEHEEIQLWQKAYWQDVGTKD